MTDAMTEAKAAARKAAFAARKEAKARVDESLAQGHLAAVLASLAPRVLAGYMPIRTEIDPLPVMRAYGGPVSVPVIEAEGRPLLFQHWTPSSVMVDGPFGAQIPQTGAMLTPQVLVVPLVAFDGRGYRLGYGGGFYDRTLERLRRLGPVTAIGFAFAAQELDDLPLEPTDEPLDLIVTELGVLLP